MSSSAKRVEGRMKEILAAWETLRPAKVFAGLTLEQAKQVLEPSFTTRDRVVEHRNQLVAARRDREKADRSSRDILERLVAGIKSDPDETGDGGLYQAMGYVPKSARRSGLTRLKKQPAPASLPAAA